jgi:riboflavin kinase
MKKGNKDHQFGLKAFNGEEVLIANEALIGAYRKYAGNLGDYMRGKIVSGLGQARYFISREGYSRQFLQKLGFIPFPGTLNVLLEEPLPEHHQAIKIEGFEEEGQTFGECRCYRIKVNGIDAAAVRPERSRHPPDLIEVIAPVRLRELGLEEGDPVEIIIL